MAQVAMKGIVFTEFIEMAEGQFGWETMEDVIDQAELPSGGAYTTVGTYAHQEMVTLATLLSKKVGLTVPELLIAYGKHLFHRFYALYPHFYINNSDAFSFLEKVDEYIHVEVRKLYPDAELPVFRYERPFPHQLIMAYQSERPFADFAQGLLLECIVHFDEPIHLARENLEPYNGTRAKFILTKTE